MKEEELREKADPDFFGMKYLQSAYFPCVSFLLCVIHCYSAAFMNGVALHGDKKSCEYQGFTALEISKKNLKS